MKSEMENVANSLKSNTANKDSLELSRDDLINLLKNLEAKLQASEIAIAVLKNDRLKRLFYPPIFKRPAPRPSNKKVNKVSLNYETIKATNKSLQTKSEKEKETNLNENLETVLNTNLDDEDNDEEFTTRSPFDRPIADVCTDDFDKEFKDSDIEIQTDSQLTNDEYNEYQKNLEKNPYLALARDLQYAYDGESHESLIIKVYNSRVLRFKQLIKQQRDSRKFLENQYDELNARFKTMINELEIEKDKNIQFQRDEIVQKLEKTEQDKKTLEEELNALKKEMDAEKERQKVMIVYLLSERKQLIIRLIEETGKNTELVNLLSSEKDRTAEAEEGLEEESKRNLQLEIDLETLTNKYETEKTQLEHRNQELESECQKLQQKLDELLESNNNSNNNNNLITSNKNLPDLGEGVRSTIVTFNNAIAASSTVVSSAQQSSGFPMSNMVQSQQTIKPSLAAKPSFDSINNSSANTNGRTASSVTILNSQQLSRTNSLQGSKPISSLSKMNSVCSSTTTTVNSGANKSSNIDITPTSTSVASVIQKFSNNTISNTSTQSSSHHQSIVKKLSASGIVSSIAQTIAGAQQASTANTITNRGPPPPVPVKPTKPQISSQLLKERASKIMPEQSTNPQQFAKT